MSQRNLQKHEINIREFHTWTAHDCVTEIIQANVWVRVPFCGWGHSSFNGIDGNGRKVSTRFNFGWPIKVNVFLRLVLLMSMKKSITIVLLFTKSRKILFCYSLSIAKLILYTLPTPIGKTSWDQLIWSTHLSLYMTDSVWNIPSKCSHLVYYLASDFHIYQIHLKVFQFPFSLKA